MRNYNLAQLLKNLREMLRGPSPQPDVVISGTAVELRVEPAGTEEVLHGELLGLASADPREHAQALLDAAPPIDLVDPDTWAHWCACNTDFFGHQAALSTPSTGRA